MQQMRNDWRNEQQAQLQLQHDEEEEEHQRFDQHRELMHGQQRLEEAANNVSRQNIAGYQAQINNNCNDDDDIYVDEPVWDPVPRPPSPPDPPSNSPPLPPPPRPAGGCQELLPKEVIWDP